ncbi:MAG: DMT family transporter [Clostridioides sp.]|nr:DMT family transporter [Clostridioides sp.]
MKKYYGEIGLIIVTILWGFGFVGVQYALDGGLTPLQTVTLRFFIGTIVFACLSYKKIKGNFDKRSLKSGIILGILLFFAFSFQTIGQSLTTASKNAFITATNVVIVPFLGYIFYKRKLDFIGISCSILALIGIAILSLEADFSVNFGDILVLMCAFGFAGQIFFTSEFVKYSNLPVMITIEFATACVLSFITQIIFGETSINITHKGWFGLLYISLISTVLCYFLQTVCQKIVDSTRAAIILSLEAVFGTIFAIFILGEPLTLRLLIGSTIILFSVISAETKLSFLKIKKSKG